MRCAPAVALDDLDITVIDEDFSHFLDFTLPWVMRGWRNHDSVPIPHRRRTLQTRHRHRLSRQHRPRRPHRDPGRICFAAFESHRTILWGDQATHKVIGRFPGEANAISLVWAVLDRASPGWRGLTMTPFGARLLQDLRRSLLEPPRELRPLPSTTSGDTDPADPISATA